MEIPTLHGILFGFLFFAAVVVSGVFLIGDINANYDLNIDNSSFSETYNTVDEIYNITRDSEQDLYESDISEEELWSSMTKGGFKSILNVAFSTPELLEAIMKDIATTLGLPPFVVRFVFAGFFILLVALAFYFVMRLTPA